LQSAASTGALAVIGAIAGRNVSVLRNDVSALIIRLVQLVCVRLKIIFHRCAPRRIRRTLPIVLFSSSATSAAAAATTASSMVRFLLISCRFIFVTQSGR
jgi:hypothetical protein